MKIVGFADGDSEVLGMLSVDGRSVRPFIGADGAALRAEQIAGLLADTMGRAEPDAYGLAEESIPLEQVRLRAPVTAPPKNVFCVGKNYLAHSREFERSGYDKTSTGSADGPALPIIFTKPHSAIIGPEDTIDPHPSLTKEIDYEAEIVVIIGRGGRGIAAEDAWDHVWGMTLANDVTARDLQRDHQQWHMGKALDTFLPMGPWAVSQDELDLSSMVLECTVNGELRQQASPADMIFDIPTLIETISAGITLEPGDLIATGTPEGVGIGFTPPRFIGPGDEVVVSAHGLGVLRNVVGS